MGGMTSALAASPATGSQEDGAVENGPQSPRNIIFMVSDGMSLGVPSMAEPFSQLVRSRGTHWLDLAALPAVARGHLRSESLSSMVTDSSAASSAWATGSRVFNGAVNVLPDGTHLTPIGRLAREAGRAIGLVSTTQITHATPAGFASVQPRRADQHLIAPQYLDLVDVILGGGHEFFAADKRKDGEDLYERYRDHGYSVCRRKAQMLASSTAEKLLGCFWTGHLPYTIDQINQPAEHKHVPTLAEMTETALAMLSKKPGGFLLQVEGGRVDHAAHANDAAAMLWDQLAFDDAIGVVRQFVGNHPDTLVVITTDHGNSNPGLIGVGGAYRDSTECFERLAGITASFTTIYAGLRKLRNGDQPPAADDVIDVMRGHTQITIKNDEAEVIANVIAGHGAEDVHHQHRGIVGALGQTLANHTGIAWTGTTHTQDFCPTLAFGPGSGRFATLMHHTDVYGVLASLMGVEHTNPSISPEEAKRQVALPPESEDDLHWI